MRPNRGGPGSKSQRHSEFTRTRCSEFTTCSVLSMAGCLGHPCFATQCACYRGPKPQHCPKGLGEGVKGVLTTWRHGKSRKTVWSLEMRCKRVQESRGKLSKIIKAWLKLNQAKFAMERGSRRKVVAGFDQLQRWSRESLLHQCNPVLHHYNPPLHQCNRPLVNIPSRPKVLQTILSKRIVLAQLIL